MIPFILSVMLLQGPIQTIQVQTPRTPVPAARGGGPGPASTRRVPIGTSSIAGVVVAADTGRPLPNARVNLNGSTVPTGGAGGSMPTSPVPGASGAMTMAVNLMSGVSRTAMTDAQGQFVFSRLPAGRFTLIVNRQQYLATAYGQKKPGPVPIGVPIELADGQQVKVSVPMARGSVITGTVMGEDGEPAANTQVRALRYTMASGVRRLQSTSGASTDDRGVYRMFGLQPGQYVISATPQNFDTLPVSAMTEAAAIEKAISSGAVQPPAAPGFPATVAIPLPNPQQDFSQGSPGFLPTYAPGTATVTNATSVSVAAGEERTNIDIQLQLVQASNIQGTINNPPGQAAAVQVGIVNDDPTADTQSLPSMRVGPDGRFTLRTIPPGSYTITAQTVPTPMPQMMGQDGMFFSATPAGPPRMDDSLRLWAREHVTVDGQSAVTVALTLQPGRSISGTVQFEGAGQTDAMRARLSIVANPAPGTLGQMFSPQPQAQVGADGRFTLNGLAPGKYMLRANGGQTKSSVVAGEDTLDFPLDFTGERDISDAVITMADPTRSTELSGTVTDGSGKPAWDYTIILAARDSRYWTPGSRRLATARLSPDGTYAFRGVAPGDYLVAAVADLEPGGQFNPELLKTLASVSLSVQLSDGARQTQDIRLAR